MNRFGFFENIKNTADVGEAVTVTNRNTASTNALVQCIAVEISDPSGKRTLVHISPFALDNPLHTENPQVIADYWIKKGLQKNGNPNRFTAMLFGGRKGDACSEALRAALLHSLKMHKEANILDSTNICKHTCFTGQRTITSVLSLESGVCVHTFSNGHLKIDTILSRVPSR